MIDLIVRFPSVCAELLFDCAGRQGTEAPWCWSEQQTSADLLLCSNCAVDLTLCLAPLLLVSLFLCERHIVCAVCTWEGTGHFTRSSSGAPGELAALHASCTFYSPAPLFTYAVCCSLTPPLLPWLLYSSTGSSFTFIPSVLLFYNTEFQLIN